MPQKKIANWFKPINRKILVASLIVAFFVFLPVVRGPFMWDDESELTLTDRHLYGEIILSNIDKLFSPTQETQNGIVIGGTYRPIATLLSGLANYTFSNESGWFHFHNIVLHLGSGIFVFLLATEILQQWFPQKKSQIIASLTASIFLLHPGQVESVSYISSFAGLYSSLFFFCSFYLFFRYLNKGKKVILVLSLISFGLSIFCKESGQVLLPLIALFFLFYKKDKLKVIKAFLLYVCVGLLNLYYIFFYLRIESGDGGYSSGLLALESSLSLSERLLNFPLIFLGYLKILLLPLALHMERHFWIGHLSSSLVVLVVILFTLIVSALIYLSVKNKWLGFFLGWILLALLPFFQIIPLNATIAERWLYIPMFGFATIASILLFKIWQRIKPDNRPFLYQAVALIFVLMIIRVMVRNEQWVVPLELYKHDAKLSTNSFVVQNNVGVELFRANRISEAKPYFARSIELEPSYSVAHNNYAVSLQNEGKIEEALKHYQVSISLTHYYLAYVNVAKIFLNSGQNEKAAEIISAGLEVYPTDNQLLQMQEYLTSQN